MLCKAMRRACKCALVPLSPAAAYIWAVKTPPLFASVRTFVMDSDIRFGTAFEDMVYPFDMDLFSLFELPTTVDDGDTATTFE